MDELRRLLEERREKLQSLIAQITADLENTPPGMLRITHNKGKPQFFYRATPDDRYGKYICKADESLALTLAGKDYRLRILKAAETELRHTETALKNYHPEALLDAYLSLSPVRRELVRPYIQPRETLIKEWLDSDYVPKPFKESDPEIFTEKRERVRSKSEKMIADKLSQIGIPYRYEAPLELDRYTTIHPDFTLLNPDSGEEFFLEHNGMMDDSNYSTKAVLRIRDYIRHGIFPGDRLLLTFETSRTSLDMQDFEAMILNRFSMS